MQMSQPLIFKEVYVTVILTVHSIDPIIVAAILEGKINGHKSIYILNWRCIQDEFYVIFMQPCLNKLLQSQAEVCVLVVNAKQVHQSSV